MIIESQSFLNLTTLNLFGQDWNVIGMVSKRVTETADDQTPAWSKTLDLRHESKVCVCVLDNAND